ncbi:hypothetical protein BC937DRAFT_95534 [Endogone sp. FLAS-F59071]|nr:hypothetical protein BC937DRAFT_95534 [Endogone sp. FLAS-F59071]|eukprot:RUS13299.1 hypothetical protein BC937DRAFT_95534 [Endogone sp. FLAS-F59071]
MIVSGGTTDPTSNFSSSTLSGVSSISAWNTNGSWYSLLPYISAGAPAVLPQVYAAAAALTSTGPMLSIVHNTTGQSASGSIQVLTVNQWDMTFPTPGG